MLFSDRFFNRFKFIKQNRFSNEEMLSKADALIAFWDSKGRMTKALIDSAKAKGIKVAIVKY